MRSIKFVSRNAKIVSRSWGVTVEGEELEKIFKTLLKAYGKDDIICDLEVHITPKANTVLVDIDDRKYASLEDFEEAIDEQKAKEADPES